MEDSSQTAPDKGFEDFSIGQAWRANYLITTDVYQHFLAAFNDQNPLHTDDPFARAHGFPCRVMHGTILNGFLSHLVGMCFPGRRSILHSVAIRYKRPCHLEDQITLEVKVVQKVDSLRVLVLTVLFRNLTRDQVAAKARVQVGFTS